MSLFPLYVYEPNSIGSHIDDRVECLDMNLPSVRMVLVRAEGKVRNSKTNFPISQPQLK